MIFTRTTARAVAALAPAILASCAAEPDRPDAPAALAEPGWTGVASAWAKTGQPLVRLEVNGTDAGWFILDSGAGAMAISPSAADAAGMGTGATIGVRGGAGRDDKPTRTAGTVRLGPLSLEGVTFVELEELDASAVRFGFGRRIAGVCGRDVFQAGVIDIDGPARAVRVASEAPAGFDAPWRGVETIDRRPHLRCVLPGGREPLLMIDTGFNSDLAFSARAASALGLGEGEAAGRSLTLGIGGGRVDRRTNIGWMDFAGVRLDDLDADLASDDAGYPDERVDGMLGAGVTNRCRVVFDLPRSRVSVTGRAGACAQE